MKNAKTEHKSRKDKTGRDRDKSKAKGSDKKLNKGSKVHHSVEKSTRSLSISSVNSDSESSKHVVDSANRGGCSSRSTSSQAGSKTKDSKHHNSHKHKSNHREEYRKTSELCQSSNQSNSRPAQDLKRLQSSTSSRNDAEKMVASSPAYQHLAGRPLEQTDSKKSKLNENMPWMSDTRAKGFSNDPVNDKPRAIVVPFHDIPDLGHSHSPSPTPNSPNSESSDGEISDDDASSYDSHSDSNISIDSRSANVPSKLSLHMLMADFKDDDSLSDDSLCFDTAEKRPNTSLPQQNKKSFEHKHEGKNSSDHNIPKQKDKIANPAYQTTSNEKERSYNKDTKQKDKNSVDKKYVKNSSPCRTPSQDQKKTSQQDIKLSSNKTVKMGEQKIQTFGASKESSQTNPSHKSSHQGQKNELSRESRRLSPSYKSPHTGQKTENLKKQISPSCKSPSLGQKNEMPKEQKTGTLKKQISPSCKSPRLGQKNDALKEPSKHFSPSYKSPLTDRKYDKISKSSDQGSIGDKKHGDKNKKDAKYRERQHSSRSTEGRKESLHNKRSESSEKRSKSSSKQKTEDSLIMQSVHKPENMEIEAFEEISSPTFEVFMEPEVVPPFIKEEIVVSPVIKEEIVVPPFIKEEMVIKDEEKLPVVIKEEEVVSTVIKEETSEFSAVNGYSISQLQKIERGVSSLDAEDKALLQIINLIEATGKHTFDDDFEVDLCKLDSTTIKKIEECLMMQK